MIAATVETVPGQNSHDQLITRKPALKCCPKTSLWNDNTARTALSTRHFLAENRTSVLQHTPPYPTLVLTRSRFIQN